MSICSTDIEAAKEISAIVCNFIKSYKRVRYDELTKGAGCAIIDGIETNTEKIHIDEFLTDFFSNSGWKIDKRSRNTFSKTT